MHIYIYIYTQKQKRLKKQWNNEEKKAQHSSQQIEEKSELKRKKKERQQKINRFHVFNRQAAANQSTFQSFCWHFSLSNYLRLSIRHFISIYQSTWRSMYRLLLLSVVLYLLCQSFYQSNFSVRQFIDFTLSMYLSLSHLPNQTLSLSLSLARALSQSSHLIFPSISPYLLLVSFPLYLSASAKRHT